MTMSEHVKQLLETTRAFADSLGPETRKSLDRALERVEALGSRGNAYLYKDFAPHSFVFNTTVRDSSGERDFMSGGIIFYPGDVSGSDALQYSTTLSGEGGARWEVHT